MDCGFQVTNQVPKGNSVIQGLHAVLFTTSVTVPSVAYVMAFLSNSSSETVSYVCTAVK